MPTWLQPYIQDKRILIGAGAGLLLLIILVTVLMIQGGGGKKSKMDEELTKQQKVLAQINGYGKAIEIQALLSRQGIHLDQDDAEGASKIKLIFRDKATQTDRDKALVSMVQSGLMDKNVGLEAFDQGDLTASREEKRIKLIRAQQGELSRLIKKIEPIQDASVSIAVPEQTLFKSEQKPLSASVQVTLPLGTILTSEKTRAITNLMVGALQGLTADHVAISDTNGRTYNSILSADSEVELRLQEQDQYMQEKVAKQLDRLVGIGNYVVTVSTQLREGKKETMVQEYAPKTRKTAIGRQQLFYEKMNTESGNRDAGGATSSFLPDDLSNTVSVGGSKANKDYARNGLEVSYENSRTQWMETSPVGMIENISIAVTIDSQHFPEDMSARELQVLLAHAASPKATAEGVTIVKSSFNNKPLDLNANGNNSNGSSGSDGSTEEVGLSSNWMLWAGGAVLFFVLLVILLEMKKGNAKPDAGLQQTQAEIEQLKELASQQQVQIQEAQQQASRFMEQQQQYQTTAGMLNQQQPVMAGLSSQQQGLSSQGQDSVEQVSVGQGTKPDAPSLAETLQSLEATVSDNLLDEEDLEFQIKNWIESG